MRLSAGDEISHYRIVERLGSGGMGEVYLATDTILGRRVAIKTLPISGAPDPERLGRLTREAQAASALSHPNIAHVYEIGDADGVRFIAMEYVEGVTLDAFAAGAPVASETIVDLMIQLADALEAAHRHGIVHRDIKPRNLIVSPRGQLKVLDFGLAKFDGSAASADRATVVATSPGVVMGSAAYMSPEQALGRDVDSRSDLFATGVVLYEIASGRGPFAAATILESMHRVLHDDPPPLRAANPRASAELERIASKCLEKDRDHRYQSATDLLVDLKNLRRDTASVPPAVQRARRRAGAAIAIAAAIVAAVALGFLLMRRGESIDSIAVLPFVNEGADPQTEYLSDGIPDTLIDSLSQIPSVRVIALSSVTKYKGRPVDAATVGRELGVRAVMTGRVVQRGNDLAVAVELADARDNSRIWGRRYARTAADIVAVQHDLARDVSDTLQLRLSGTEQQRLVRRQSDDTEAYRLYLKGRYFWNQYSEEGFKRAIEFFNQAIARDPAYALAYAGLADAHMQLGVDFVAPLDAYTVGKRYADRAIALDPSIGEPYASIGMYESFYAWDLGAAEKEFARSLQLSPRNVTAHHFYAHCLDALGRYDEAIAEMMRGLDSDPLSPFITEELAWTYYHARRYDEAIAWSRKALDLDPSFDLGLVTLADVYAAKKMYKDASATVARSSKRDEWPVFIAQRARLDALDGRTTESRARLSDLLGRASVARLEAVSVAGVYAALGDRDGAFQWLNRGIDERSSYMLFLNGDATLDALHGDPRWTPLRARVGLPH